jgi:hypothetical protein
MDKSIVAGADKWARTGHHKFIVADECTKRID